MTETTYFYATLKNLNNKGYTIKTIATLIIISTFLFADSTHAHHSNKNQEILHSMHQTMYGISMSCNVDIDFLTDMIAHHQGVLDSATLYLDEAKNENLKEMAQQIIDTQSSEIKYFEDLIEKLQKEKKDCDSTSYKEFQDQAQIDLETMMQEMNNVTPSENIDFDFAKAMIEHHKGAINSSKTILKYTNNAEIKEIANNIIKLQDDEIKRMQQIISAK